MDIMKAKFSAYTPQAIDEQDYLRASVLVPLLEVRGRTHVLFEVRSETLNRQPGEISFPGGKCEEGETPEMTACRETSEELGVAEKTIEILGPLDYLVSPIGVRLHAYVGRLHDEHFRPNSAEVGELFTVPLEYLLNMEPHKAMMQVATKPKENFPYDLLPNYDDSWRMRKTYPVYFYPYQSFQIWGLTARVLKNFLDIYKEIM